MEAYELFIGKNPHVFCHSLIGTWVKSKAIDNNICETFNGYIVKARTKSIIYMLEEIRCHLMVRMTENIREIIAFKDVICPKIRKNWRKKNY